MLGRDLPTTVCWLGELRLWRYSLVVKKILAETILDMTLMVSMHVLGDGSIDGTAGSTAV
jgi:hypothetical protein